MLPTQIARAAQKPAQMAAMRGLARPQMKVSNVGLGGARRWNQEEARGGKPKLVSAAAGSLSSLSGQLRVEADAHGRSSASAFEVSRLIDLTAQIRGLLMSVFTITSSARLSRCTIFRCDCTGLPDHPCARRQSSAPLSMATHRVLRAIPTPPSPL
jgi:hypothetical protein